MGLGRHAEGLKYSGALVSTARSRSSMPRAACGGALGIIRTIVHAKAILPKSDGVLLRLLRARFSACRLAVQRVTRTGERTRAAGLVGLPLVHALGPHLSSGALHEVPWIKNFLTAAGAEGWGVKPSSGGKSEVGAAGARLPPPLCPCPPA